MKHINKLLSLLLVLSMAVLAFASCGGGAGGASNGGFVRDESKLNILVFDGGYGEDYINRIAEAFEAEYPGIDVVVDMTDTPKELISQITSGRYVADIVMSISNVTKQGVQGYVADLTDVYESYAFGESDITIGEKLAEAADANNFDGHYYQIPSHTGGTGLVYNKVYLDAIYGEGNWELPVTSDGLIAMFKDIQSKNAWPMVYTTSTEAEYSYWLRDIWMAQYLGYQGYKNYFNLQYENENGEFVTATTAEELNAAMRPARDSAIEALISVMSNKMGNAPESCASMSFSQAQGYFVGYTSQPDAKEVNGHKGAAFMINGDWLWSEVERYSQVVDLDFRFMRTPINSAIIDKLSTVNSEEQLVECIKYIDTVLDGTAGTRPAYISDADYERLLEARRMVRSTHTQQSSFVPSNCSNLEVAKDFLKFYASDACSLMYSDAMNGMKTIYNDEVCAENKLNTFTTSINYALNSDPIRISEFSSPYTVYGGLSFFRYHYFTNAMYKAIGPSDAKDIIDWHENDNASAWSKIISSYTPKED